MFFSSSFSSSSASASWASSSSSSSRSSASAASYCKMKGSQFCGRASTLYTLFTIDYRKQSLTPGWLPFRPALHSMASQICPSSPVSSASYAIDQCEAGPRVSGHRVSSTMIGDFPPSLPYFMLMNSHHSRPYLCSSRSFCLYQSQDATASGMILVLTISFFQIIVLVTILSFILEYAL